VRSDSPIAWPFRRPYSASVCFCGNERHCSNTDFADLLVNASLTNEPTTLMEKTKIFSRTVLSFNNEQFECVFPAGPSLLTLPDYSEAASLG